MLRDNISEFDTNNLISAVRNVLAVDEVEVFDDMVSDGATAEDVFDYIVDGVIFSKEEDCCGDQNCPECNALEDEDEDEEEDVCENENCPCHG